MEFLSWGNTQVNTTTKPLFEETLNIVFECFDKYKHNRPLLPVQCLKNYSMIYNESDDKERLVLDDNQIFSDKVVPRPTTKEAPPQSSSNGTTLPRLSNTRQSTVPTSSATTDIITRSDSILPAANSEINLSKSMEFRERKERVKPDDAQERLRKLKALKERYTFSLPTRSIDKLNQLSFRRPNSSLVALRRAQQKRRIELKPINHDSKRSKSQAAQLPSCEETIEKENAVIIKSTEADS